MTQMKKSRHRKDDSLVVLGHTVWDGRWSETSLRALLESQSLP